MEAYRYAEGNRDKDNKLPPPPKEFIDLGHIDRFGVRAVMGRDELAYHEIQAMLTAENIINAYRSRKLAKNWAEWAQQNQQADELLKEVEIMLHAD